MRCFYCGSDQSSVVDKRAVKSSGDIRRRRECMKCNRRFTTYERVCFQELTVIKRDGRREDFDRNKLRVGLSRALEKRPALVNLDAIVVELEKKIRLKYLGEVESKFIGRAVLLELKKIDKVGYLRFASVYRHFENPQDFSKELEHLRL